VSVEFVPKKEECFCFEAPNGHLFALLREPSFSEILGDPPRTNDSIDASDEQAIKLAAFLRDWDASGWGGDKYMYIEFFEKCGGFTTY
jgi:hypothetical protein